MCATAVERLCDGPILEMKDENKHIEDPFLWYDENKKLFCILAKDDPKNGSPGITGMWGSGFYAQSRDCITFDIPDHPCVYTRRVSWLDGHETVQGNLERPWLLFDGQGKPEYLYCASGAGQIPYAFEDRTFVICQKLVPDEEDSRQLPTT